MTWKRIGQLTAETQTLADVVEYNGVFGSQSPTISSTKKYTGGHSYRMAHTYGVAAFGVAGMSANAARLNCMFNHNFGVTVGTAYMPIAGFNVGGQLVSFYMREDGNVGLRAGYEFDTPNARFPLASVPAPAALLTQNLWLSIGAIGYFAEVGGFVTLYVDGQQVLSWTGDTRIYASNSPGGATPPPLTTVTGAYGPGGGYFYGISPVTWGESYVDDLYADAWDGPGAPNNYPPTLRRFLAAFPIADTPVADWTPNSGVDHYAMVDEAPPDDDATRLKADGPGLSDIYAFGPIVVPSPEWSVRAAIVAARACKTDSNFDCTLRLLQQYEGTVQESDEQPLGTSYNSVWSRWEAPPGAEAWTEERINAARFGIRSDGSFSDYG